MYMKDPTKLKLKLATHLDLFLDQCLSFKPMGNRHMVTLYKGWDSSDAILAICLFAIHTATSALVCTNEAYIPTALAMYNYLVNCTVDCYASGYIKLKNN